MSLASDTDLWMFITSSGGLTAGRVDADGSLFPYVTATSSMTPITTPGRLTLIRVDAGTRARRRSGSPSATRAPSARRSSGTSTRTSSATAWSSRRSTTTSASPSATRWAGCDEFGWVRTATLENRGARAAARQRAGRAAQRPAVGRAAAPLSAGEQPRRRLQEERGGSRDRARHLRPDGRHHRPRRGARGPAGQHRLVLRPGATSAVTCRSRPSPPSARAGSLRGESVLNGRRGNYLVTTQPRARARTGAPAGTSSADVGRDHVQIVELRRRLREGEDLAGRIEAGAPAGRQQPAAQRRQRRRPAADGPRRRRGVITSPTCSSTTCAAASSSQNHDVSRRRLRRLPARAQPRRGRPAPASGSPRCRDRMPIAGTPRGRARERRRRSRAAEPRVPAAVLRPAPRRPQSALEPLLDPRAQPPGRARAALRGQLARHLPELGGAGRGLPGLPAEHGGQVRQRLDRGRLQPLPHHPRRRGLGDADRRTIPGATSATGATTRSSTCCGCSRRCTPTIRGAPGAARRRDLQLRRGALPPQALRRASCATPGRRRSTTPSARRASHERVARAGDRRQAAGRSGRRRLPRQPAREAARAGPVQALEPDPRRAASG